MRRNDEKANATNPVYLLNRLSQDQAEAPNHPFFTEKSNVLEFTPAVQVCLEKALSLADASDSDLIGMCVRVLDTPNLSYSSNDVSCKYN